jgi:predicted RNA binding protein YcfA (HicA-like mRNA interferase family)
MEKPHYRERIYALETKKEMPTGIVDRILKDAGLK